MIYQPLRLCSQGGGFEAVPSSRAAVDLARVRRALEAEGVPVVDARVLLIATLPPEVTIARSGRLLFKTPDAAEADAAFARLAPILAAAVPSRELPVTLTAPRG
jgi:hypothetical protein